MTTICWDGRELVADSRMSINMTLLDNGKVIPQADSTHRDDMIKIIAEPGVFTFGGEPVQALAWSGDWDGFKPLCQHRDQVLEHGVAPLELIADEHYVDGGMLADIRLLSLIIITATRSANIAWVQDLGWQWRAQHRSMGLTAGSRQDKSAVLMMNGASSRYVVSAAMVKDPMTGGTLTVWSEHQGLRTGLRPYGKSEIYAMIPILACIAPWWQHCLEVRKLLIAKQQVANT